ncbi:MAG: DegV family protein [Bacteroidales bacterium]|nr:DegV family protein [Clostridium sp.]MCM1204434.1 DegV family protein [Bacteroidales bacterium]
MAYQIITDSSCDLSRELVEEKHLHVVPFYISFDEEHYFKENEEIKVHEFYQKMVDNPEIFPKTSLPSVEDYLEAFTPYIKDGKDIICICITTKFSGSYNSASTAKDILLEDYPDARITVIDATVNTVLQGILVLEAARMQEDGLSYSEVIEGIDRIKKTGRIIFTVGNMDYLIHGGRVGKVMKVAVNALKIRPMIILKEGEIFPFGIARSRKKSIQKILDKIKSHFDEIGESPDDYQIVIGYGYDYEEAVDFRKELLSSLQAYSGITDIGIFQIGAMIGVHTGPYPLGVGLLRRYDR